MTNEAAFQKLDTTQRACVSRIVKTYRSASADTVVAGNGWYDEAAKLVDTLLAESNYSREQIASCISHLSPQISWKRNVIAAKAAVNGEIKPSGVMSATWNRAIEALKSDNPLSSFNGPKTKRFALNILGDHSVATIDVWAFKVVVGNSSIEKLSLVGVYEAIEYAYRLAAKRLNVSVAVCQAVCWVQIRGRVN